MSRFGGDLRLAGSFHTTTLTPPSPPTPTTSSMSLLTPPHSSEKENPAKFSFSLSVNVETPKMASTSASSLTSRSVVWSPQNSYHSLTAPAKPPPSAASTNAWVRERPVRSILKKRRAPPLADSTNSPEPGPSTSSADVFNLKNLPEDLDALFRMREATPEPSDPLCDLNYLAYPVSLILKEDCKPRELIEGYSVLAARLRTTVQFKTDADASWPLFQPLRKQTEAFVDCVVRDLGRALVDPIKTLACPSSDKEEDAINDWKDEEETGGLPSPVKSPKKPKKRGMTASQVKYARDLCTICHAVIKLLCIVFSVPATFSVFEDKQLKSILNAALAIPMADNLPTPNARKTCALVILLLQCQRLPENIVLPARDRIALALKRGISGQLGKEGKKGSANDGLKAIHDLSIFQPKIFVPVFTSGIFIRSILHNLVAPTLALRVQACHALGGLSYALASIPPSSLHATVSNIVIDFITTPAPATPTKPGKLSPPSLPLRDSLIIRTLRTTMNTSDATHIAQSSVWGMSVISSLIVLFGSRMYTNRKACQTLINVLKIGLKGKKMSIRHLFGMAWRSLTWAWFQPDYDTLEDDGEEEKTDPDEGARQNQERKEVKAKTREAYFQLLNEVVDMQTGMSTVLALLICPPPSTANPRPDDGLRRALFLLQSMANSPNPDTINDAVQVLANMLPSSASSTLSRSDEAHAHLTQLTHSFLPRGLFSSHPTTGLLAADPSLSSGAGSIMNAVRPLFDRLPNIDEVRTLSRDELKQDWVWNKLCKVWRTVVANLEVPETMEVPEELGRIWEALLVSGLSGDDEDGEGAFVERVMDVLIGVLEDRTLDFSLKVDLVAVGPDGATSSSSEIPFPSDSGGSSSESTTQTAPGKSTKHELKFKFVKPLFSTVRAVMSKEQLAGKPLSKLFTCLINSKNVSEWTVPRSRGPGASRKRQRTNSLSPWNEIPGGGGVAGKEVLEPIRCWATFVASVISAAEGEVAANLMKRFWGVGGEVCKDEDQSIVASWDEEVKSAVWKTMVNSWKKGEGVWEGAVALLAVPFSRGSMTDASGWSLSTEETTRWKELYEYATGKALDYGMDSANVVDGISEIILASKERWNSFRESSAPVNTPGSSFEGRPDSTSSIAASLIQVSDLLLDHLDISEARDLPMALVSLVNDTLKSSYPPSPRNISPATWLIQALTRVVENCPGSLVGSLVEGLCDGLSLWLGDESEVWTEDVLDYTFLPLYQHLLLRVQTCPKDLDFLDTISGLLGSIFSGRAMPESIVSSCKEAFAEFWNMSPYSKMDEPVGGWPKKIKQSLGLEDESVEEPVVPVTPIPLASPEIKSPAFTASPVIVPATPKRAVDPKRCIPPRTPMATMNGSAHIPSPHRPHKDHLGSNMPFPLPVYSPASPVRRRRRTSSSTSIGSFDSGRLNVGFFKASGMMGTVSRRPGESPVKRRRVNSEEAVVGKENTSPLRRGTGSVNSSPVRMGSSRIPAPSFEVASIADRIAASTRKRPEEEAAENAAGWKRRKLWERMAGKKQQRAVSPSGSVVSRSSSRSTCSSDSSDDERWAESVLVPFPTLESTQDGEEERTIVVKKRKRMFMESVLIPAFPTAGLRKRKLQHAASFDISSLSASSSSPASTCFLPSLTLSPSPAITETLKTPPPAKRCLSGPEALKRLERKRKRSLSISFNGPQSFREVGEDPFEMEISNPMPTLQIPSYIHPAPNVEDESSEADLPSSDDDPRYGQVTPHHIVSPPLAQRTGRVYGPKSKRSASDSAIGQSAGSDDDLVMGEPGSSPSRKVAERRMLQKQNSLSTEGLQRVGQLKTVFSW